tara:strand:- start:1066 stop:3588 length:2523 start_codon:yes stop_codon:yes gene_type:complete
MEINVNATAHSNGSQFQVYTSEPAGSSRQALVLQGHDWEDGGQSATIYGKLKLKNGYNAGTNIELDAISKDISDTAIDLFVYDTRKDSDGGAWRERTQHTSWYNEALNTSTRGARKEFPSVAVIVVRAGQVITIYDADDPDMPMWMVFNGSNLIYGTVTPGIEILNGIMFFTGNVSCSEVNFITEFMGLHQGSSISQTKAAWSAGIINRNNTAGNWTTEKAGSGSVIKFGTLVNQATNDIAMKVLPNAPINNDTGLAVPTIVLATDGGVSVIKDDGTVKNIISNNSTYNYWDNVKFTKDNKLIIQANYQNTSNQLTHIVDIPLVNISASNVNSRYAALNGRYYHGDSCSPRLSVSSSKPKVAALEKNNIAIGHRQDHFGGINLIAEEPSTQSGQTSNSAMAYINSVYNTGWFVGNTKIAALSSTDSTNISSSGNTNILAGKTWTNNGSFPYETLTTSGLNITSAINTTAYGAANLTWTSTPGKTYTVHFNMTLNSGNMPRCFMQTSSSFGNGLEHTPVSGANSFTFTATRSGSIYFSFSTNNGDASNYSVSGLELYEGGDGNHYMNPLVVQDHIGLSAIGTVTKTVVATGADLMGYSGFSASNFLEQPYVSGLNAGTGGYSVTFWVKNDGTAGTVACRGTADNDESMRIYMGGSTYGIYFDYGVGAPYCYLSVSSDRDHANNGYWHQVVVHVSANGPGHIYLDGKKMPVTVAGNAVSTIPNDTDYKLRIGAGYGSVGSAGGPMTNGSIALFRYSLTIPTDEQIARIYNDEKYLFQENAKSVIVGTSNTVTALAYDEDTKLLHVGSAWGRSAFRGLNRVEEHLNYVPQVAISASSGMVAEE